MSHSVVALVARSAVLFDSASPWLVHDVVKTDNFVVPPHLRVPVSHRLESVELPPEAPPLVPEELGQEVLVRELEGGQLVGRVEEVQHLVPQLLRWMIQEHSRVEQVVCWP